MQYFHRIWQLFFICFSVLKVAISQPKPVVFGRAFGSGNRESTGAIAVRDDGYFFTTGRYQGPSNFGGKNLTGKGIYLTKNNPAGAVVWAKAITSICPGSYGTAQSIFLDKDQNIYLTGTFDCAIIKFSSTDSLIRKRNADQFVAKYDSNGNVIWYKHLSIAIGSPLVKNAFIDGEGNIVITGLFSQKMYIENGLNEPIDSIAPTGNPSFFGVKFTGDGTYLHTNQIWCKGNGLSIKAMSYDSTSGSLLIAGAFKDSLFIGNHDTLVSNGQDDAFIGSLNLNGSEEVNWLKSMGDTKEDQARGISVDAFGNIYATGTYFNQLPVGDTVLPGYTMNRNFYLAKFRASDGGFIWARSTENLYGSDYGPGLEVGGNELCTDTAGNIFVAGYYSTNVYFDKFFSSVWVGGDMFLVKYDSSGKVKWLRIAHSADGVAPRDIKILQKDKVVVGGNFTESIVLDNLFLSYAIGEVNSGNYRGDVFIAAWPTEDINGYLYYGAAGKSFPNPEVWYPHIVPGTQDTVIFYRSNTAVPAGNQLHYQKVIIMPGATINVQKNASLTANTFINAGNVQVNGELNVEEVEED